MGEHRAAFGAVYDGQMLLGAVESCLMQPAHRAAAHGQDALPRQRHGLCQRNRRPAGRIHFARVMPLNQRAVPARQAACRLRQQPRHHRRAQAEIGRAQDGHTLRRRMDLLLLGKRIARRAAHQRNAARQHGVKHRIQRIRMRKINRRLRLFPQRKAVLCRQRRHLAPHAALRAK